MEQRLCQPALAFLGPVCLKVCACMVMNFKMWSGMNAYRDQLHDHVECTAVTNILGFALCISTYENQAQSAKPSASHKTKVNR